MCNQRHADLCSQYGITFYRVGEIYDADEQGNPIPEKDKAKWFVAVLDGQFDSVLVKSIPLSNTLVEAQFQAVTYLGLAKKNCSKCGLRISSKNMALQLGSGYTVVSIVLLFGVLLGGFGALNGLFEIGYDAPNVLLSVFAPVALLAMIWHVSVPKNGECWVCPRCGAAT